MQVLLQRMASQFSAAEPRLLLTLKITSTSSPRIVGLHSLENQEIL